MMINIRYFYSSESESALNLEIWKSLIDSGEEGQKIYYRHTGNEYSIQLEDVTKMEHIDLPESVRSLLIEKKERLPVLMVNKVVRYDGAFSVIDAINEVLDISVSLQIEGE